MFSWYDLKERPLVGGRMELAFTTGDACASLMHGKEFTGERFNGQIIKVTWVNDLPVIELIEMDETKVLQNGFRPILNLHELFQIGDLFDPIPLEFGGSRFWFALPYGASGTLYLPTVAKG